LANGFVDAYPSFLQTVLGNRVPKDVLDLEHCVLEAVAEHDQTTQKLTQFEADVFP